MFHFKLRFNIVDFMYLVKNYFISSFLPLFMIQWMPVQLKIVGVSPVPLSSNGSRVSPNSPIEPTQFRNYS